MSVRPVAIVAALLGAAAWVAYYFVDVEVLPWLGGVLLALAVAAVGAGLVRHPGIKVISAVGAVLLAGSVFSLVRDSTDGAVAYLVFGGLAALLVALSVLRRPASGNH